MANEPADALTAESLGILRETLIRHAAAEEDAIRDYEWIMEHFPDPQVELLMRLIVEDERRHHALFLGLSVSPGAPRPLEQVPASSPPATETRLTKTEAATLLINAAEDERASVRILRQLAEQHKDVGDGLLGFVLELVATDTEKHDRILRYAARRLGGERR
jgi:hypothetical protein